MIDTFTEKLMTVDETVAHFSKVTRRKRNRHVILRWMNTGCAGTVLETVRIGKEIFTSKAAVNRFTKGLADSKLKHYEAMTAREESDRKKTGAAKSRAKAKLAKQANELGV